MDRAQLATRFEISHAGLAIQPLYTSADPGEREEMSHEDIEEGIAAYHQIEAYDEDGNPVDVSEPVFEDQHSDCGVVVNLQQIQPQFQTPEEAEDPLDYTTYPLAFCRGIGNCQASTHLKFYQPFVDRLNHHLHEQYEDLEAFPVQRGPHQLYNEISHKTRAQDGLHESQRGNVTAALAGKQFKTARLITKHSRAHGSCNLGLPAQAYNNQVARGGSYIGLRSEPTIVVQLHALPEELRTGE